MALDPVTAVLEIGNKLADHFFPNAADAAAAKQKLLELQQSGYLAELANETSLQQLDVQDRTSARALASARGFYPQIGISAGFLCGYFGITFAILTGYVHIPDALKDIFEILLGVLTGAVPQILNFWLGSSHSAQKNDATIASIAQE